MNIRSKKNDAVSPVIGTILLVAITVVLVAIISAVVMGMTGNIGSSKVVGVQVGLNADNTQPIITITGGADAKSLQSFVVYESGSSNALYNSTVAGIASPVPVGVPYQNATTTTVGTPGKQTINVVGTFSDGTQQSIYTGEFTFKA